MDLRWPWFLLALGLIPVLIAAYLWMMRRRRRFAVRYSSLSLVRAAMTRQSQWRRHLPFALFLLALTSLTVAMTRPVSVISVPAGQVTIILTLDVSRSMCSTDIAPNRLVAAKEAATSFIEDQAMGTQIGVVAFAGFAQVVAPPTSDQEVLQDVVESLTTGRRTAVGSAILKSIDAIAEIDPSVAPSSPDPAKPPPVPVAEGAYSPNIVVLLTDGATNAGPQPVDAAQIAVERGIRVYTIGFGTAAGGPMDCGAAFGISDQYNGSQFGGSGGGNFGGGGGGGQFRRGIDEETLKLVSDMTGGEYYSAESADELQKVFSELPTYLITKHETTEISAIFAALGALCVALAIGLSMLWNPLP